MCRTVFNFLTNAKKNLSRALNDNFQIIYDKHIFCPLSSETTIVDRLRAVHHQLVKAQYFPQYYSGFLHRVEFWCADSMPFYPLFLRDETTLPFG